MVIRGILKFIVGTVVVLFLALLLGVVGFFIVKSLDPNIFRVEFEKHLTQKTGLRVELGKIAFDWGPQIRLQLDGLKFYNPQSLEKMLQSDSVAIEVDLAALFRKKFWMPRATIRNPEVFVKRRADGSWIWQPSLSAQARPTGAGLTAPLAAAQPPAGSGTQGKTGSAAVPVSAETPKGNLPNSQAIGRSRSMTGLSTMSMRRSSPRFRWILLNVRSSSSRTCYFQVSILRRTLPCGMLSKNGSRWKGTRTFLPRSWISAAVSIRTGYPSKAF